MFSVGATRIETPSSARRARRREPHSERAMKQSVSSGMCGPCCSVVPIGISTASTPAAIRCVDLGPGHALDQVLASRRREFDVSNVRHVQTRASRPRRLRGRDDRGQRRQPVAPDHGRGRAGRSRSTARASATSTSTRRRPCSRSTSRSSTSTCAATAPPTSRCSTTTWRSGPTTSRRCRTRSASTESHIHGTSMGGMIAIIFAGKYPERTTSVVINCAAAKLGRAGRLIFKNWIDIAEHGSRRARQPHPRRADLVAGRLEGVPRDPEARPGIVDHCQQILRDSNRVEVFTAACQAMCDMDITPLAAARSRSPALVLGGDEDIMTPWDQGPGRRRARRAIYQGIAGAEKHVIRGVEPLDDLRLRPTSTTGSSSTSSSGTAGCAGAGSSVEA